MEEALDLWSAPLREVKRRLRPLFAQVRSAMNAGVYLDGLLGDERRKTGWMRAPRQRVTLDLGGNRRCWAMTDVIRTHCATWCGTMASSVLRTMMRCWCWMKLGSSSRARHHAEDAAIHGFGRQDRELSYRRIRYSVLRHGYAFNDGLYSPKIWIEDPARLKATYVPSTVTFATKPQLAAGMIARAIATQFHWVAGDTVYGTGDIERDLRGAGKGYVLGVGASHVFRFWGNPRRLRALLQRLLKPSKHLTGCACRLGWGPRGRDA